MSMRHHWQELDELLAQLDREARFKRGPFRPGMKPLSGQAAAAQAAEECESADEPTVPENLVAFKPMTNPR